MADSRWLKARKKREFGVRNSGKAKAKAFTTETQRTQSFTEKSKAKI